MKVALAITVTAIAMLPNPASGQKPLPPPPPGFKVVEHTPSQAAMKKAGIQDSVEAEKPNDNWPGCIVDPKILLSYSWTNSPGAGQVVEMMANMPEEPASDSGHIYSEPAGKQRYKGGVLTWRKSTIKVIGSSGAGCKGRELVTYDATWAGFAEGKLLGVGVIRVYESKIAAQGWIDEYVPKVIAAATGQ